MTFRTVGSVKEPFLLKPRGRARVRWRRAARGMPARAGTGACAAARAAARGTRARTRRSRQCVQPETEGRPTHRDTGRARFLKPDDFKKQLSTELSSLIIKQIKRTC